MTATQRGAVAESMVCTWALKQGYIVSFPARGTAPQYDMVIDSGMFLSRVQVKRAHRRKRGAGTELRVSLTDTNGHMYSMYDVERFAIVDVDSGRIWFIPSTVVEGKAALGLTNGKHDRWLVQ